MPIEVSHFRQSFVWAATLLGPDGPANPQLGVRAGYAALFDAARKNREPAGPFAVPWPNDVPAKHLFWANYLTVVDPSSVPGDSAWTKAVPLRVFGQADTASLQDFTGSISIERYVYPFGVGLIVTFTDRKGRYEDYDWTDLLVATGQEPLAVAFAGEAEQALKLEDMALAILKRMRAAHFGAEAAEVPKVQPFVVTTVLSGAGVAAATAPEENGQIHRLLYGAASRRANYRDAVLPTIEKSKLDLRNGASPGDVVFAVKRGRAIWMPSSFVKDPEGEPEGEGDAAKPRRKIRIRKTSMSCYHRNQVFAALQTESLGGLAHALVARLGGKPDGDLPGKLDQLGKIPATILADLHDGKQSTYRSDSLKHQIVDGDMKGDIAVLRTKYALPAWP